MTSVIIVDGEDFYRSRLSREFEKHGYVTYEAKNYKDAIPCIEKEKPDLALVDLKLPDKTGLELTKKARSLHPAIRVVIMTGYGSIATAIRAIKLGAVSYITKPANIHEILTVFQSEAEINISLTPEEIHPPSLARAEWEHINRVLNDCRGNISKTAKKLGIHRRSLQRKLVKYPPRH